MTQYSYANTQLKYSEDTMGVKAPKLPLWAVQCSYKLISDHPSFRSCIN